MTLANLFKITYASGVIEYIRDEAADAEAMVAKMSGLAMDEAKKMGLIVEHMVGMGDPVVPTGPLEPIAITAPPVVVAPVLPVLEIVNSGALPPGDLTAARPSAEAIAAAVAKASGAASRVMGGLQADAAQAEARFRALQAAALVQAKQVEEQVQADVQAEVADVKKAL